MSIEAPRLDKLISSEIMMSDKEVVVIKTFWNIYNPSQLAYSITDYELYFYQEEEVIGEVYFSNNQAIKPFKETETEIRAKIKKSVFEKIIKDKNAIYTFNLGGKIKVSSLILSKEIEMEQLLPIEVSLLK
jgi:LEA14-like dessication related protein